MIFSYIRKKIKKRLEYPKNIKKISQNNKASLLSALDYGIFRPFTKIRDLEELLPDAKNPLEPAVNIEKRTIQFYELCRGKALSALTEIELDAIILTGKKSLDVFHRRGNFRFRLKSLNSCLN